jgi:predicted porin
LAALAATSAFAQSSVEIYGIADIGYSQVTSKSDKGGTIKQTGIGAGGDSSNGAGNLNGGRLGFRGTEDLGSGLKAGFLIEYGINLTGPGSDKSTAITTAGTTNSGTAAAASENAQGATIARLRQGGVNLSSAQFGKVTLGTQYAYHDATSGAIAGSSATGGTNNVVGASNLLKYGYTGGQPRLANAVSYESPVFSGVQLKAMRNQGKAVQDSAYTGSAANAMNANSYAIDYSQDAIKGGFAQTKYSNVLAATSTTLAGVAGLTSLVDLVGQRNDQTGANVTTDTYNITNRVMGGQYNAGFVRFGLNRGTYEAESNTAANSVKSKQTMGSVAYPMGKTTLIAGYTTGTIAQGGTDAYKTKAFDLIAVYELSKRTNVYALAVQTKYDSQAASPALMVSDNAQQRQYGVGVRHSF